MIATLSLMRTGNLTVKVNKRPFVNQDHATTMSVRMFATLITASTCAIATSLQSVV